MIVVQHLWSHWTKASRAAAAGRPRLPDAAPLPEPWGEGAGRCWLHDLRRLEREGFETRETAGWSTPDDWAHAEPMHPANIVWRESPDGGVALSATRPWGSMLRTAWPAVLPSPLLSVGPERVARIIWNGRFMSSAGGSDGSYFYAEHTVLAVSTARPRPALFTAATDIRTVDLRTRIY